MASAVHFYISTSAFRFWAGQVWEILLKEKQRNRLQSFEQLILRYSNLRIPLFAILPLYETSRCSPKFNILLGSHLFHSSELKTIWPINPLFPGLSLVNLILTGCNISTVYQLEKSGPNVCTVLEVWPHNSLYSDNTSLF